MKRTKLAIVLVLPLVGVLAIVAMVVAGRPVTGQAPSAAVPDGMRSTLAAGNVLVETSAQADLPALRRVAGDVMGLPAYRESPARRRRGTFIEIRHDPSSEGIVAYADDGILRVSSPDELRLRDFLATSLGRG